MFRSLGASAVELLLALPVVILLGLGVVQLALVYQARHALETALAQAARQGAVDHASPDAILRGLAAGLVPYLQGAQDWTGLLAAEAGARAHVDLGMALGWIRLRQRSPTQESFDDWAEPALDPMGERIPGMLEIPNDNLANRRLRTQPVSGAAASSMGEPVGRRSGQSLADANLLRLELAYGVRLAVPVVGPLVLRTLSLWHGCTAGGGPSAAPPGSQGNAGPPQVSLTPAGGGLGAARPWGRSEGGADRLGLLDLGTPARAASPARWMCPFLAARDEEGRARGRLPLRLSATVRMMSTARRSAITGFRVDLVSDAGPQDGAMIDPGARSRALDPGGTEGGGGVESDDEDAGDRGWREPDSSIDAAAARPGQPFVNGFLQIGSDRAYPVPREHPALCAS